MPIKKHYPPLPCEQCGLTCLNMYQEPKRFEGKMISIVLCQTCIRYLWEKGVLPPKQDLTKKKRRKKGEL